MKSFKSINEMSLSRVWKHYTDDDTAVLIISAFRGQYTFKVNIRRNKELASKIRKEGFGYVYVDGHWIEKDGGNEGKEDSIFVTSEDSNKLEKLGIKWLHKYDQDAIVFKPAGGSAYLILNKKYGGAKTKIGKFNIKAIEKIKSDLAKEKDNKDVEGAGYTKLRSSGKRHFVFEEYIREETGWMYKAYK